MLNGCSNCSKNYQNFANISRNFVDNATNYTSSIVAWARTVTPHSGICSRVTENQNLEPVSVGLLLVFFHFRSINQNVRWLPPSPPSPSQLPASSPIHQAHNWLEVSLPHSRLLNNSAHFCMIYSIHVHSKQKIFYYE